MEHFSGKLGARGASLRHEWMGKLTAYRAEYPALAAELDMIDHHQLPDGWDKEIPVFPADAKGIASRDSSQKVLNAIAKQVPWLIGGAADLAPSTKSNLTFEGAGSFEAAIMRGGTCISAFASMRWGRSATGWRWPGCGLTGRGS